MQVQLCPRKLHLLNVVNGNYLAGLRDNDIVDLFLYGYLEFPWESNKLLFEMAQTYIINSERFDGRPYHLEGNCLQDTTHGLLSNLAYLGFCFFFLPWSLDQEYPAVPCVPCTIDSK